MAKNDYKDVRKMLEPRRDIKASAEFRKKIESILNANRRRDLGRKWIFAGIGISAVAVFLILIMIPDTISANKTLMEALSALRQAEAVEMRVEIRTNPKETFEYIIPQSDFIKHDIKLIRSDSLTYWYVGKEQRAMEKNSEGIFVWQPSEKLGWLYRKKDYDMLGYLKILTQPEKILESELQYARSSPSADYTIRKEKGLIHLTVHSGPEGDFTNPYVLNMSVAASESIRVYTFSASDYHLRSLSVSVVIDSRPVEVIRLTDIDYNPGNKRLPLLPKGIEFIEPEAEDYAAGLSGLNEKESAAALLNSFLHWDRETIYRFIHPAEAEKLYRRGYEGARLVEVGEPFSSGKNKDLRFVPYTLRMRDGSIRQWNLALLHSPSGTWLFDGGL